MNDAFLSPRALSEAERLDWLRLYRSENVGPVTFALLMRRFGSARAALDALPDLARRGGRKRIQVMTKAAAEAEWDATQKSGARLIARCEAEYPPLLAATDDAPPIIVARGAAHVGKKPTLGIVGARNASAIGLRLTRQFAQEAGRAGMTVASGLARGIDASAHEGSLATGTIAVLGTGIDEIYPPENEALFHRIAEAGLILTDYPVGTAAKPQHFVRRNRIIAGLSLGVLLVEAALKSGSLHTARFAADLGREVFAVPGSPLDARAQGCNQLIKEGATLTQSFDDILNTLRPLLDKPMAMPEPPLFANLPPESLDDSLIAAHRLSIVEKLGFAPVPVDDLIRLTDAPVGVVQMVLLELELAGRLARHPGGQVSLLPEADPALFA